MVSLEWLGSDTSSPGGQERWACSQNQEPIPTVASVSLSWGTGVITGKSNLETHSFFSL